MEIIGQGCTMRFFFISLSMFISASFVIGDTPLTNYVNDYDGPLNWKCPDGEYISEIHSEHDNKKEDRQFKFACKSGNGIFKHPQNCWWTGNLNGWDDTLNSICEKNGIITGFQSVHDSKHEDRIWKFHCCQPEDPLYACRETEFINNWDEPMSRVVAPGFVIRGIYSEHHNKHEDRRWKLKICRTSFCMVTKLKNLETIQEKFVGARILGSATGQLCEAGHDVGFTVGRTDDVRESITVSATETKSHSIKWGLSVEVSAGVEIGSEAAGIKLSHSVTFGAHLDHEYTTAKSIENSNTVMERDVMERAMSLTLSERSGGLVLILSDEYEIPEQEILHEVTYECKNGTKYTLEEPMIFKAHKYENVHVEPLLRMIPASAKCDFDSSQCLKNLIKGGNYLDKLEDLYSAIDKCFEIDADSGEKCCPYKTVRDIKYQYVGDLDDYDRYGCVDKCLYKEANSPTSPSICFMDGDLPTTCSLNPALD